MSNRTVEYITYRFRAIGPFFPNGSWGVVNKLCELNCWDQHLIGFSVKGSTLEPTEDPHYLNLHLCLEGNFSEPLPKEFEHDFIAKNHKYTLVFKKVN